MRSDSVDEPLYVCMALFNPARYQARWRHFAHAVKHMADAGAEVYTIEAGFGHRAHVAPEPLHPAHTPIFVRVGDEQEIWLKENLQGVLVRHLPPTWRNVAFADADMAFARPDIVAATLHALQHFDVVQMFSHIVHAGPDHTPLSASPAFSYQYTHGLLEPGGYGYPIHGKHRRGPGSPGGAWAWRREAFDAVGGLIDWAILGAADWYMAKALIGEAESALDPRFTVGYRNPVLQWQARAEEGIKRNVGYIDGTVWHHWHGSRDNRAYGTRANILIRNAFDPATDLKRDWQGVISLTGNKPRLRDDIRRYFAQRDEDSTHVPGADQYLVGPKPLADWSKQ